jgi:chorismate lyase/3-hydroxybenzoate synthase
MLCRHCGGMPPVGVMDSLLSSTLTQAGLRTESLAVLPMGWDAPAHVLGLMAWAPPSVASARGGLWMHEPLLDAPLSQRWDLWHSDLPCEDFQQGCVRGRRDGQWVLGTIDVPECGGVEQTTHAAYCDLFSVLQQTGCKQLLRVWNYLPRINEEAQGLERYRQFNAGRQQAFLDMGFHAFEGAPAACALGAQDQRLRVRFLAGRQPVRAIENPRQVPAYRYSSRYGARSPSFSRAALADLGGGRQALFLSGTASVVGEVTAHPGDIDAQLRETLLNIHTVLAEASREARSTSIRPEDLIVTVYLRHAAHAPGVRQALQRHWGAQSVAVRSAVYVEADICRSDLLVEIEGHLVFEAPTA